MASRMKDWWHYAALVVVRSLSNSPLSFSLSVILLALFTSNFLFQVLPASTEDIFMYIQSLPFIELILELTPCSIVDLGFVLLTVFLKRMLHILGSGSWRMKVSRGFMDLQCLFPPLVQNSRTFRLGSVSASFYQGIATRYTQLWYWEATLQVWTYVTNCTRGGDLHVSECLGGRPSNS